MPAASDRFIIATHTLVYGAPQALCDYLAKTGAADFYFISHGLTDAATPSTLTKYSGGKPETIETKTNRFRGQLAKTLVECLRTIGWGMGRITREIPRGDRKIFIGVNPINAFAGLVLKRLGYVDKVVYYTIDFVPQRHPNPLINRLYHAIDHFCYFGADAVWNVSSRINEGRARGLYKTTERRNVQVVPIGVWLKEGAGDEVARAQNRLVFIGHLLEKQGVQYVLPALPLIRKTLPDAHLLVIGGGEYEEALRAQAKALSLEDCVTFTGWVKNREEAERLLKSGEVALAPYDAALDTFTYYADPTKLKDYLQCGLPILSTDVPHNAHEIEARGCGKLITLSPESIAEAAIWVLADREKLAKMRENTKHYIEQFAWERIFSRVLSESNL